MWCRFEYDGLGCALRDRRSQRAARGADDGCWIHRWVQQLFTSAAECLDPLTTIHAEGFLTARQISDWYTNYESNLFHSRPVSDGLRNYLTKQLAWARAMRFGRVT